MTPRAARLLRGLLVGAVATLLAAVSHTGAGGVAPSALSVVLGTVFAGFAATIVLGRSGADRMPPVRTAVAILIGQLGFHLGFSLLSTDATVTVTGGHHDAIYSLAAGPAAAVVQGGLGMIAAHLLAGVMTLAYLLHLENRLWYLLEQLGIRVTHALQVQPTVPVPPRVPVQVTAVAGSRRAPLRGGIARRGPPRILLPL